jgi:hypothetical protein
MALVNEQAIPPELAELYAQTLGATRLNVNPGGKEPCFTDICVSKYPSRLEPPHLPTFKQLRQREYFQDCFACFNLAPENERRAYWRLSRVTAMYYYNLYMSRNIPLRIQGYTCPSWSQPNARSFISDESNTWGRIEYNLSDEQEHTILYTMELDQITVGPDPPPGPTPLAPYGFTHVWFNWQTHEWETETLDTFNPPARTEYEDAISIPEIPDQWLYWRYVFFTRYGATPSGEAVMWDTEVDDPEAYMGYWNFN